VAFVVVGGVVIGCLIACDEYFEMRAQLAESQAGLTHMIGVVQSLVDSGDIGEGIYGDTLFLLASSDGAGDGSGAVPPAPECSANDHSDRGDGRDSSGRFASGNSGIGKEAELQGLAEYSLTNNVEVAINQVRPNLPGTSGRYYDGLAKKPDGTYEGIEVKSGSAWLSCHQREFDGRVDSGEVATANLNGRRIRITSTQVWNV